MTVGNWGSQITFQVSDKLVETFTGFSRSVGAEYAQHIRIGGKTRSEFIRPKLQTVQFTINISASLGVKPRATMDALARAVEQGTAEVLVIGGKKVGSNPWKITDVSENWTRFLTGGELTEASVQVSMEEYI